MSILTTILIISLFCNGWYIITRPGMILGFINNFYFNSIQKLFSYKVADITSKPLFDCPPCMASIWGSVAYFSLGNSFNLEYPVIIIAVACVNKLIIQIYE